MTDLGFLRDVDIFKGLSDEQLSMLGKLCEQKTLAEEAVLFRDGDTANHLYLVTNGTVDLSFSLPGRVLTPATTMVSVPKGRAFGWSSLIPPYRYRLTAHCASEQCTLFSLERAPLLQLFESDMPLGFRVTVNLANILGNRFSKLRKIYKDI